MTSNSGAASDNQTLAEIVSSFPPGPPRVFAKIAKTPLGKRNKDRGNNVAQMLMALVLIEESPAGKVWGVQLAAIPSSTTVPSDDRYSLGCLGFVQEVQAHVEWFFTRSGLSESAPMATVTWDRATHNSGGITFSCDAVARMLYAAQELQDQAHDKRINLKLEKEQRLVAMEDKIAELEGQIAALNLKLQQAITGNLRTRAPIVTCLMQLFAGYMSGFTWATCNLVSTEDDGSPISSDTAHTQKTTAPTFNIAPHTDRLSDLSPDAQNWVLNQLDTRTIWVLATDPDSRDNHISWTQFNRAVEMGKSVVFLYGNHRFW